MNFENLIIMNTRESNFLLLHPVGNLLSYTAFTCVRTLNPTPLSRGFPRSLVAPQDFPPAFACSVAVVQALLATEVGCLPPTIITSHVQEVLGV